MEIENIKKAFEVWDENASRSVKKRPEREHLPEQRIYTPLDSEGLDYLSDIGFPGEYPFTRGVQPTMYRGRLWTMRQYAGFATSEESNARYKYLLEQGQTGLSCAFDLPTQIGYDSDDPIAEGEVGKVGVAIDSLRDMEILFDGIDLGKVSTSMTINAPAAVLLAMYIAVAKKQGVPSEQLKGTIQNDILKEYAARGTYIFPPKPSMRLITDIFRYCSKRVPLWNTISISGYHIREAGSTAAQELAFTIANGIAYVQAAIDAGLDVDDFAGRLSFFWNAHNNVLEEVCKFRASRKIWSKIMKERFGAKKTKSLALRFHTQTAGSMLTAQQPDNNIVRVTLQTVAAVLGGTQSLHTNSRDEALALPTEDSVRTALRTQQIVAFESGLADVIDPLAGSYYIESLTSKLEKEALEYIDKIDKLGGAVAAIENGYVQKEIQDSAYAWQKEIENEERIIVGVNKFTIEEPPAENLLRIDESAEKSQREKLKKLKAERNSDEVKDSLYNLRIKCENEKEELMPAIIRCVESYATLGEICGVMREVFGEYSPHTAL